MDQLPDQDQPSSWRTPEYLIDLSKHGLGGLEQNAGFLRLELRGVINRSKTISEFYSTGVQVTNKFRTAINFSLDLQIVTASGKFYLALILKREAQFCTVKVDALKVILSKAVGSHDLNVPPIALIVGSRDDQILAIAADVLESKLHMPSPVHVTIPPLAMFSLLLSFGPAFSSFRSHRYRFCCTFILPSICINQYNVIT